MSHVVKIDVFEGPIDLLLHLITRQRVDIYDVSLATISAEYLEAVEEMPALDLDVTTGFLVVAASLLELKSTRLLPASPPDSASDGWLEERDLLLARLVECATFRDAGAWLSSRLDAGARLHPRAVALEDRFVSCSPDLIAQVSLEGLARSAAAALLEPPEDLVDTSHLGPIVASVREAVVEVANTLRHRSTIGFAELCTVAHDRIAVVVRFLALLELFKAGAVDLSQAERFGEIIATWTGDVDVEAVAAGVTEGSAEG